MGEKMQVIKSGVVVFATQDTRDGILDARAWLKEHGFTPVQARLYRHDGQVLVELLKDWLCVANSN
jgi:hypothetical protein